MLTLVNGSTTKDLVDVLVRPDLGEYRPHHGRDGSFFSESIEQRSNHR